MKRGKVLGPSDLGSTMDSLWISCSQTCRAMAWTDAVDWRSPCTHTALDQLCRSRRQASDQEMVQGLLTYPLSSLSFASRRTLQQTGNREETKQLLTHHHHHHHNCLLRTSSLLDSPEVPVLLVYPENRCSLEPLGLLGLPEGGQRGQKQELTSREAAEIQHPPPSSEGQEARTWRRTYNGSRSSLSTRRAILAWQTLQEVHVKVSDWLRRCRLLPPAVTHQAHIHSLCLQ